MKTPHNTQVKKREFHHFTLGDRREIEQGLKDGKSYRLMGIRLGCQHTSIGREIRAHCSRNGVYDAEKAHQKAYVARRNSKYQGMRVEEDSQLKDYVIKKLKEGYAPRTVAGRIKTHDTDIPYASHNAIYGWLYSAWGQKYCLLLHSQNTKPRKRKTCPEGKPLKRTKRTMIPNRVSIHDRPQSVDDRTQVGNTESDTIVSAKKTGSTAAVSVMVERATCYTTLEFIKTTSPRLNNTARYKMVRRMPCKLLSDTDDNGIENKYHETFTKVTGIPVYFCDSHCSWQKGLVENINKRIRFKIPKGSDIALVTRKQIRDIEHWLNSIPRKSLGYMTPYEKMQELLAKQPDMKKIPTKDTKKSHKHTQKKP